MQSIQKNTSSSHSFTYLSDQTTLHQKIHERALEISTSYKKTESELIEVLEQVENHKVYLHQGRSSLFQYGVQDLGLSENVVYNLIAVMRKAREVPELKNQIKAGIITLGNAKRIASVITPENQNEWLTKASELTQRQLEKEIVKIRPLAIVPEHVSFITESRVKLEVSFFEKDMIQLRKAQDLVSQTKGTHASLEDTILQMMEFYLSHKDPVMKAKRILVKKGFRNSSERKLPVTAENSAIDELVLRPVESKTPHKREPIPALILHQINRRDQRRCTNLNLAGERCNQTRWTEIHHIIPVSQNGKNTLENLTTLCSIHHQWIHSKK